MYIYNHTYIHTYTHSYIHTYMQAYIYTCINTTYIHNYIHLIYVCMNVYMCVHKYYMCSMQSENMCNQQIVLGKFRMLPICRLCNLQVVQSDHAIQSEIVQLHKLLKHKSLLNITLSMNVKFI